MIITAYTASQLRGRRLFESSLPAERPWVPDGECGLMRSDRTRERRALFESWHEAPPTPEFPPVSVKTHLAAKMAAHRACPSQEWGAPVQGWGLPRPTWRGSRILPLATKRPTSRNFPMKTNRLSKLVTATAGLAAFALTVGADTAPKDDAVIRPPSVAVISIKVTNPAPRSTDAFLPVASAVPTSVVARWGNLKDCDFSQRARLFADLGRLEAMVDEQIGQLQVQRDAIKNSIDPMAWEFAMQELVNARSFLKASAQELRASTPEMWSRLKEKVSLGLTRTQNACDRVRSSSTSA